MVDHDFVEIEVLTSKLNDKGRREVNPERSNSQINPCTETHNETVKEELFETPMGGSTRESINTNTNNKIEAQRYQRPKYLHSRKGIAWWQHPKRVKATNFQIEARLLLRKMVTNNYFKQGVRRE